MTTTIHVDRKHIVSNNKTVMKQDEHGTYTKQPNSKNPPIVVEKDGLRLFSAHEIEIRGPSRMVYHRESPYSVSQKYPNKKTSVTVWIETESEVIKIK